MITSSRSCVLARRAFVRSSMIERPGVSSMRIGRFASDDAASVSNTLPVRSASRSVRLFIARKRDTTCLVSISSENTSVGWPRLAMLKAIASPRLVLPTEGRAATTTRSPAEKPSV